MHPTLLWVCHRSMAALGTTSTQQRREDLRAAKQARHPHLLHALYLRVLLGLWDAQLSHRIYMLYAFHESLTTSPEPLPAGRKRKGGKTWKKEQKTS